MVRTNPQFFQWFSTVFASPGGPKSSLNGSEIALARVLASLGAHLARSWRLLAASWRSWGLLGASWAALGAICSSNIKPGYHGTGSALEARAASTASGEQQSRKASRKHSLQASRARSAPPLSVLSWGFAWNASRAGGRNGSLQTKKNLSKMAPKCHPGGSKIAPRWLPGGSRAPPESANESGHLFCSFFSPLGRLLGLSWGAPGGSWGGLGASWAAPGRSRGAPGGHFSLPGVSFWNLLGLFFEAF